MPIIPEVKAEYSDEPVIIIQKHIKMYLARKKYKKIKNAVIKLQSFERMSSVKGLYQNILSAIIYIQRFWRQKHVRVY